MGREQALHEMLGDPKAPVEVRFEAPVGKLARQARLEKSTGGVDHALAKRRHTREIAVCVPHFAVAPAVVAATDAIATLPRRLPETFVRAFDLRVLPAPLELPRLRVALVWHSRSDHVAGTQLLKRLVRESAAAPDKRRRSRA
jgi:DNA-binding transcriptional LysR family regulator